MKQVIKSPTSREATSKADYLSVYDRYGSLAYGVILRIIADPTLAQKVLVDLFASQPLNAYREEPAASDIIRLARRLALDAKAETTVSTPVANPADPLEKHIFDLAFCQGYTPETIAETLQLSPTSVLKSIYTYFKYLRSS